MCTGKAFINICTCVCVHYVHVHVWGSFSTLQCTCIYRYLHVNAQSVHSPPLSPFIYVHVHVQMVHTWFSSPEEHWRHHSELHQHPVQGVCQCISPGHEWCHDWSLSTGEYHVTMEYVHAYSTWMWSVLDCTGHKTRKYCQELNLAVGSQIDNVQKLILVDFRLLEDKRSPMYNY